MDQFSDQELQALHQELKSILEEVIRICQILDIRFFVTGGTAIGAYFFQGFVKWDDDIDLGMTRKDYELFQKEAPKLVSPGFFVQCFETEPRTPFFFIKVRKDNTLFIQEAVKDMNIHQGIFVDIFPFDHVPDNHLLAKIHQRIVQYLEGSFKRRQMKEAILEGQRRLPKVISEPLATIRYSFLKLIPRRFFHERLHRFSALFNRFNCRYSNVIKDSVDLVETSSIADLMPMKFEGLDVYGPRTMQAYLAHHYPDLKSPDMLESLWVTHRPFMLSFDTRSDHDTQNPS